MNNQTPYILALTKIPGVGPKTAKVLVSYCGGFEAVFRQSKKQLMSIPGIGAKAADAVLSIDALKAAEQELAFLQKNSDIHILPYTSQDFPSRYRNLTDSPLFIYYRGQLEALQHRRTVGIVGTRTPSHYGLELCETIVDGLKSLDVCVISGLAYGIDTRAHLAAVEANVPTVGILGHGLDRIYPAENINLAKRMIKDGGLISEFPPDVQPKREHFPMRNRLIAGLSDAIIVVESAKKGGSIITADLANSYHKDVFAVPGRLSDERSEGCNHLIKTNRAALYQSVEDIIYIMGWERGKAQPQQMQMPLDLTDDEQRIIAQLKDTDGISIDNLLYRLEIPLSQLSTLLLNLEFKGLVRSLPGKNYALAMRK